MTKHQDKDEPSRIEITEGDLQKMIEEIRQSLLADKTKGILIQVLVSFAWINRQLEYKRLSIEKLKRLFFGAKTEKPIKNSSDKPTSEPKEKTESDKKANPKPPGHGKNGAANFEISETIPVPHATLKAGDLCPDCEDAGLYPFGTGSVLRFSGQPPVIARLYEPERLRCASCQETFTADLPNEAGLERFDPTAKAIVALLTSGTGVPAYRLEGLQKSLQVPLADSTQNDLREDVANDLAPIHKSLNLVAAQGQLLYNDDTPNKVLSLVKENESLSLKDRKGMQTTGLVAINGPNQIALFMTGRQHAGENLKDLLDQRSWSLPPPLQMGDALSRNVPREYEDLLIKCLCMDHGRRNFVEILDSFKSECQHVVLELAKIYKHDAEAKEQEMSTAQRLEYHQTHSALVMNELNSWMEEKLENKEVEPNSNLGKAISYFLKHWNGLTQFLRVEGAPLSNAECERLLKKCVLRRKNSYFYKTEVGAWIGDILMSVIETCRLNQVNPFNYLVAVQKFAAEVRKQPELWLPWNYQQNLIANP